MDKCAAAVVAAVMMVAACSKSTPEAAASAASDPPPAPAPAAAAGSAAPAAAAPGSAAPSRPESAPSQQIHASALASAAVPVPTATPMPKPKMVSGSGFSEENFAGTIAAPTPLRPGASATASVSLSAKAPFHCNDKYPYKFTADAPSGVSYPSSVVRGMSVAGTHASLGVPFVAGGAGRGTIAGTLSFSVCSTDKCLMQKRHVSVTIDID